MSESVEEQDVNLMTERYMTGEDGYHVALDGMAGVHAGTVKTCLHKELLTVG